MYARGGTWTIYKKMSVDVDEIVMPHHSPKKKKKKLKKMKRKYVAKGFIDTCVVEAYSLNGEPKK